MAHYYLTPYIGTGAPNDQYRPRGSEQAAWSSIDLRPVGSVLDGFALLTVPVRNDLTGQLYLGQDDLDGASPALRNAIGSRLGVTLESATLRSMIAELLVTHARTDGTRWRPLRATHAGRYEIWLGGLLWNQPAVSGGASFTESFNRSDTSLPFTADRSWEAVSATCHFSVASNRMHYTSNSNAEQAARMTTAVSSEHHYVEATLISTTTINTYIVTALAARLAASGSTMTFYRLYYYYDAGGGPLITWALGKVIAGTGTQLGSNYTTVAANDVARLTCNGTSIGGKINDVERFGGPITDTAIDGTTTGGKCGGMNGAAPDFQNATDFDTWSIADLTSVALTGTVTASITEADIVAGGKTVILTVTGDTFVPAADTPAYSAGATQGTTAADTADQGGGGRTGNGTLTCSWPASYTPVAGHFAVMILYHDQGTGTTPTDWSQVTGSPFGAGTEKLQVFYKVLVGSDAAPATTISGSGTNISHCAQMAIYTGVGSIGAIGTPSNGTGTPMTAGAITTTDDNSVVIGCCGRGDNENASTQTFGGSGTDVLERLDGGTASGSDSQVSMYEKSFPTSGTNTGNGSAATSATDPWVSVLIELKRGTPFANARAAIASGLDSGQSEAGGWDAKVKPNIPVANVVRTNSAVCTITLQAQGDYDISAQETITATVPAAALASGASIVATPTFTIDAAAATPAPPWPSPLRAVMPFLVR